VGTGASGGQSWNVQSGWYSKPAGCIVHPWLAADAHGNKQKQKSRFLSFAFSSSTAIIPPCLDTQACSYTGHSSNKFRRQFALFSSARSFATCHGKLCRFYSCVLAVIRVGKKGSRTPCRQHFGDDPAKSFRMTMANISTHWFIVIFSSLTDFPGSEPEASLDCCSVRPF
jgi:hypothetical protein